MSLRSFLPRFIIVVGAVLLLLAVFSNVLGLTSGGIGKARVLCGVVGFVLLAIGILKRKFFTAYKSAILLIANTILLLSCLEFGAMCWHRVRPQQQAATTIVNSSEREIYVAYSGSPLESEFVNVGDDGRRVTVSAESDFSTSKADVDSDDARIRVFAFGGSTMWGEGAADDETIASYLQSMLRQDLQQPIEVINFGQRGWISTQGLIRLMLELRGGNIPDVVVFYDGYNDTTAAGLTGQVGVPESLGVLVGNDTRENPILHMAGKSALGRLVLPHGTTRHYPDSDFEQLATDVANAYLQIHRIVEGLAKQYGFESHFYLQPQLISGSKPLTDEEQQIHDSHPWLPQLVRDTARLSYEEIRHSARSIDRLTDISDAFDHIEERLYLDPCHVTGSGNKRIAELMMERGLSGSIGRLINSRRER